MVVKNKIMGLGVGRGVGVGRGGFRATKKYPGYAAGAGG